MLKRLAGLAEFGTSTRSARSRQCFVKKVHLDSVLHSAQSSRTCVVALICSSECIQNVPMSAQPHPFGMKKSVVSSETPKPYEKNKSDFLLYCTSRFWFAKTCEGPRRMTPEQPSDSGNAWNLPNHDYNEQVKSTKFGRQC
jgi:hypothetical protein